ncbi:hypothetical protein [Peterkaempfera bronchialis]|uniref:hypothetical protein n=1 Tax=Peterkaempfera bronchialis TaxID=2126346 RepID=UPI003C2E3383
MLSAAASLDRVADHPAVRPAVGFEEYRTGPGLPVKAGQVAARFILHGPDHPSVLRTAEQILRGLEQDLGIGLLIGEKD